MSALTPEQEALKAAAMQFKVHGMFTTSHSRFNELANVDAILALLTQLEAAQEVPRVRSPYVLGVRPSDWNTQLAALQQPVQAVLDGARWKMIRKLLSESKLDYYFLEGRSEEEITSAIDEEISKEATIEAMPGEPGQ